LIASLHPTCPLYAQTGSKFQLLEVGRLPRPLLLHGAAVVGNRLYIIGGNFEEKTEAGTVDHWPTTVYSASINPDATLGVWRRETPLPQTRAYIENSVQVINDRIYVLGGNVHMQETSPEGEFKHSNDVLWTRVKPDGTLDALQKSEPFGERRSCAASCATDRFLYLMGGTTDGINGMTNIVYANIAAAGSAGASAATGAAANQDDAPHGWRKAGDLPIPMWYMGAAILENTLYTWGGYTPEAGKNASSKRVFSSQLQPDGTVGPWVEETAMTVGTNTAGFCGFNDYLITVAGRLDAGVPTSNIQFAHLQDKKVENWQLIDSNVESRVYHALGLDRSKGVLYITGGKFRATAGKQQQGTVIDAVQAFQLPARSVPRDTGIKSVFDLPIRDALNRAATENKKVFVFFYAPAVPTAQRLAEKVLTAPDFKQKTADHLRAAIDVSGEDQRTAFQYGVYRVPCLMELDSKGQVLRRSATLTNADEVNNFLGSR
jgi:hypothetical protein